MSLKITVGADPELFVRDKATNEFVSAYGLVPGTKEEPQPVPNGAIQVDGMALEFNIDPATSADSFRGNILEVMKQLELAAGPNYSLEVLPSVNFSEDVWYSTPDQAKEIGCDADYNAYTMEKNPQPEQNGTMRAAGGHIHIGWDDGQDIDFMSDGHMEACSMVVKQLDYTLGIQSALWDNDLTRRQMYGKAGSFRPKPFGVEYRVLSNAWLKSPKLISHVFNVAKNAVSSLYYGNKYYLNVDEKCLQSRVNRGRCPKAYMHSLRDTSIPLWRN